MPEALWDRMQKLLEDKNCVRFALIVERATNSCMVSLESVWGWKIDMPGEADEWRKALDKALNEWDDIKKKQDTKQ